MLTRFVLLAAAVAAACGPLAAQPVTLNWDLGAAEPAPYPTLTLERWGEGAAVGSTDQGGCGYYGQLRVLGGFVGLDAGGTRDAQTPDWDLGPGTSADQFYGQARDLDGRPGRKAVLAFRGAFCDFPDSTMRFRFFASKSGVSDNRQTCYTVFAGTTATACLTVSGNTDAYAEVVVATPRGSVVDTTIRIEVTAGPDNDSDGGLFYLGAVEMAYIGCPRTLEDYYAFSGAIPDGTRRERPLESFYWEIGDTTELAYASTSCDLSFKLSTDGGNTFVDVATDTTPARGPFRVVVPDIAPGVGRLYMYKEHQGRDFVFAISPPFTIAAPGASCRVGVIGSGTAAGLGAANAGASWVARLRRGFPYGDTRREVVDLTRAGLSAGAIVPTGTPTSPDTVQVDPARNVTAALARGLEVLIVGVGDVDIARGLPVATQVERLVAVVEAAEGAGVTVFVTTPHPRAVAGPDQAARLALRDSVLARFGAERVVDHWAPLANADGLLREEFRYTESVEPNDAAHLAMYRALLAKGLDTLVSCSPVSSIRDLGASAKTFPIRLSPNPTRGDFGLAFALPAALTLRVDLVDAAGRLVTLQGLTAFQSGEQRLALLADVPPGVYVVHLSGTDLGSGERYGASVGLVVE